MSPIAHAELQDRLVILASQSPRRRELLRLLVPPESIEVRPPREDQEQRFDDLDDWPSIESRLADNARTKCDSVLADVVAEGGRDGSIVLAADTIIVGADDEQRLHVLEKPPEPDWQTTVRRWFDEYLIGRSHWALTAFCMSKVDDVSQRVEDVVRTTVTFRDDCQELVDWYLSTEEPRGKAGGYGLQGAADVFVSRVDGSVSNVVGLPLADVLSAISKLCRGR